MQTRLIWVGDAGFVAESGSGHAVVIDGPPEIGGRNLAARPMELMLMAVASCSAMDVVMILGKQRQHYTAFRVEANGTRADSEPKVFTDIQLRFELRGPTLDEAKVKRAVALSAEKYCSASIMLARAGVNIHHEVVVLRD